MQPAGGRCPIFPAQGRQTDRQTGMVFPAIPKAESSGTAPALQQSRDRGRPAPPPHTATSRLHLHPTEHGPGREGGRRRSLPGLAPAVPAAFAAATRETLHPSGCRDDARGAAGSPPAVNEGWLNRRRGGERERCSLHRHPISCRHPPAPLLHHRGGHFAAILPLPGALRLLQGGTPTATGTPGQGEV